MMPLDAVGMAPRVENRQVGPGARYITGVLVESSRRLFFDFLAPPFLAQTRTGKRCPGLTLSGM